MLDQFFADGAAAQRLRANPVGSQLDSFTTFLARLGYAQSSIRACVWLLADLGRWLKRRGFRVSDLQATLTEDFLRWQQRRKRRRRGDAATLRLFLDHLRAERVLPAVPVLVDRSPLGELRTRYEEYLRVERGLSPPTVRRCSILLATFLGRCFGDSPLRPSELQAGDVTRFLLRQSACRTPKSVQVEVSGLRSVLRFLRREGAIDRDLAEAVPTMRSWRLADVPKYLTSADVARVIESCDRHTAIGRRDYAVVLLLARLGLRAGEVVRLECGDLNWRVGELTVRGKGSVHDRLPLPAEVGEALAAYLRTDRPACPTRHVFVRGRAPHRGFHNASTVSAIVCRAVQRAGLTPPTKGAHLLRHSLATDLLRHGASLAEIGEVLRHRAPHTTEIYAKVDIDGLRTVARPWPATGGAR